MFGLDSSTGVNGMAVARDLGAPELWRHAHERAHRRREAARRRRSVQRISVPLAVVATAAGANVTAFAGTAAGARTHRAAHHHLRILRRGMHGADVAHLQRILGLVPDGDFGRSTERAVRRFQAAHGLLVDGEVGPHTRAAIRAELRGAPGSTVLRQGERGPRVAAVQRLLGVAADGDFGPRTLAAVRAFQRSHGLVVDGQVGPITLAALHRHPARSHGGGDRRASLGSRAAGIAEHEVGVPYVWGGASPAGFDCSGLVMWTYARLGVHLPHFAASQYLAGPHVARADLRPGDLVFFDHLGHVGIYVGANRFVHAPHTGDHVRISSLTGWYAAHYDGATRVA